MTVRPGRLLAVGILAAVLWLVAGPCDLPGPHPAPPPAANEGAERTNGASVPAQTGVADEVSRRPGPRALLSVAGTAFAQDGGTPLSRGEVTICQGLKVITSRIGPDGRFRLDGLSPGFVDLRTTDFPMDAGGPVVVKAAAGDQNARVVLAPRTRLRIEAIDTTTGRPLSVPIRVVEITPAGEKPDIGGRGRAPGPVSRFLVPGDLSRFRVEADGYFPSPSLQQGFTAGEPVRAVRVSLQPDPEYFGVLELVLHLGGRGTPERVLVYRSRAPEGNGGWGHRMFPSPGGRRDLRLPAGELDLEVRPLQPFSDPTHWAPVRLHVVLPRGGRVRKEITFWPGGYVRARRAKGKLPTCLWFVRDGLRSERRAVFNPDPDREWEEFGPLAVGEWRLEQKPGSNEGAVEITVRVGKATEVVLSP